MAEISDYVIGPYEGVSESPPQARIPGTCNAMEDCIATIPNGVQKRPPFTWMGKLFKADGVTQIVADPFARWVDIPRGSPATDVSLLLNRESGSIVPYLFLTSTMAPIAFTSQAAAALTYLNTGAPVPNSDLRTCSVEDVTFITNRKVTVALKGASATTRPHEAFLWVRTGGYGRTYAVTVTPIGGGSAVTSTIQTASGAAATDVFSTDTVAIALAMFNGTHWSGPNGSIAGALNALISQGFTVTLDGSLIYISHPTLDFTIDASDGIGNTALEAVKGSVQAFSDLPAVAPNNFVVRVAQSLAGGNSDYYAQFVADSSTTSGHWKEVIGPGADLGLDPAAMPVGITDTAGVWALVQLPWTGRTTGDATLSLDPDFLGDQITDVGWWRGRLVLGANGGVSLSSSASPYAFYTSTLVTAVDSDPIGLLPPADRKSLFKQLVLFDQRLIAFGDKMQGIVQADSALVKPSGTGMFPLSDGDFLDQLPVQGCNHKVYFASGDSQSLAVFELAIDRLSGLALPEELTPAVPTYLPATLDRAATIKTDYVTVYGSSGGSRFIVHAFRHAEQQRVQNSWFAWNLPTGWTLGGMYMKGRILYAALIDTLGKFQAMTVDLTPNRVDAGGTLLSHIDMRVTEAQATATVFTASGTGGSTAFTLPIPVSASIMAAVRAGGGHGYTEGYTPTILSTTATTVTLQGDWRTVPLWFGYTYASYFIPTTFYKMGQDGKPERSGRLTIQRLKVDVAKFGYLRAEVSVKGRPTRLVEYDAFSLGGVDYPLDGSPIADTDTMPVVVGGKTEDVSIKFVNDRHLGFKMAGLEWVGSFTPRAQRVT